MPITAMDLVANAKQNITEISVTEAKQALSEHLIIDVREPAEFANGQIPNAVNIPRGVLEFQINNHPDFTGQHAAKIIVCCQSGGRSALATESLHKLGYLNAISLAGGYKAWAES
ncbi:MAG: rhodanese-like domain-containing protein [Gammaproteobacteria bacterium]|jgi:rhodanese-related sulfurtransferase|nr:rhodanese-like domain-containing protein [Gammaproteobacteria bacterium]MBT4147496.1 rhodanese-like domain-containing protein [Gammaproteobacteria bacterium]MBT5221646.1 rhodanese-like domain-containing protein [Gammaproteobacteria bacterium]MBT5825041.1 rhodanese-like domain-containing protein [Gammaproteobacteria bacterium]MBT5967582.1 rhodanese-like domain-containing protein [Gammaproteobacteria bacterium]